MGTDLGGPPKGGFAQLVSELLVADLRESLRFWQDVLGFEIAYERPEDGFAYLERPEGAQIMLCERPATWETGPLERPYGRGVMFQVHVASVDPVLERLGNFQVPLHVSPAETWRRCGDRLVGRREAIVLDPDGYLVMIAEHIGERPTFPAA